MALDKEQAQSLIDDFVIANNDELEGISKQNQPLFDATINALNFLSSRFGTAQKMQIVEKPKTETKELDFVIGDVLYDVNEEQLLAVTYISSDEEVIQISNSNNTIVLQFQAEKLVERITRGEFLQAYFKIGDTFINNKGDKFQILGLSNVSKIMVDIRKVSVDGTSSTIIENWDDIGVLIEHGTWVKENLATNTQNPQSYIGVKFKTNSSPTTKYTITDYDTTLKRYKVVYLNSGGTSGNTGFAYTQKEIEDAFAKGTWIKEQESTTNATFKEGDLIVTKDNTLFEVIAINGNNLKLFSSRNKVSITIDELNDLISKGERQKLSFSIGDTFVTPVGVVNKIMGVYPKDDTSLFIKIDEEKNLNVVDWRLFKDMLNSKTFEPITKAEYDKILANKKQGQSVTSTTKKVRKVATKEEKALKKLEKELDGLSLIADTDDEAKQEYEKKLKEYNELKAKIN
jgi:hypothetical protein